jgi:hypothetical protein
MPIDLSQAVNTGSTSSVKNPDKGFVPNQVVNTGSTSSVKYTLVSIDPSSRINPLGTSAGNIISSSLIALQLIAPSPLVNGIYLLVAAITEEYFKKFNTNKEPSLANSPLTSILAPFITDVPPIDTPVFNNLIAS